MRSYFPLYEAEDPKTGASRLAPPLDFSLAPDELGPDAGYSLTDAIIAAVEENATGVGDEFGKLVYGNEEARARYALARTLHDIRRNFPEELLPLKRWVIWQSPSSSFKKMPYSPVENKPLLGKHAGPEREAHYMTFDDVEVKALRYVATGVGLHVEETDDWVAVDFDKAFTDGVIHPLVAEDLRMLPAYKEYSVSGGGLHILGRAKAPRQMIEKSMVSGAIYPQVAVFTSKFIVATGRPYGDTKPLHTIYVENGELRASGPNRLADIQAGVDKLLLSYGKETAAARPAKDEHPHPISKRTARRIHQENLIAFRAMRHEGDPQNDTLNSCAFFVGRAFAAGVFEETEEELKNELRKIANSTPFCPGVEATLVSGWKSGISEPLLIKEESEVERMIAEYNEKFFIIQNYGSKARVAWFEDDDHPVMKGRRKLEHQSFAEFKNAHVKDFIMLPTGPKGALERYPFAPIWLTDEGGRQYWKVVFLPELETPPARLNLWQGFAVDEKKGDCTKYLDHLKNIICGGNAELYDYQLKWMARAVQRPWENGEVAAVWRGGKGAGKNFAADGFGFLFGPHYMVITNAEHLVGRFNSHLRGKLVFVANEAFYAGNKQHEATLKGLVTDPVLPIEQKFVDAETDVNLMHIIVISNNEWVVPASEDERRFFVVDVSDEKIGDLKYFDALHKELNNGGREALLYELKRVDISKFNVRDVPKTTALHSQMEATLEPVEAAWLECLRRGALPAAILDYLDPKDTLKGIDGVFMTATDFIEWAEDQRGRNWRGIGDEKVGRLLGNNSKGLKKGMGFKNERRTIFGSQVRGFSVPNLAAARLTWLKTRFPVYWPDEEKSWEKALTRSERSALRASTKK